MMMEVPKNCAINSTLSLYDVGKSNREERLVIRVRRGGHESSKQAKKTENFHDSSGAGQSFGPEERNVNGVSSKELVVVVGELISKIPREISGVSPTDMSKAIQQIVPTESSTTTQIIVRRLRDSNNDLFLLVKKKEGLCKLSQIPTSQDDKQIFYYQEWVNLDNNTSTIATTRKKEWAKEISTFCSNFIKENHDQLADYNESSPNTVECCTHGELDRVISDVTKSVASYHFSGNPEHLQHMLFQLQKITRSEPKPDHNSFISDNMNIIHELLNGTGRLTYGEACNAVDAYQNLWPTAAPEDLPDAVTADALYMLGNGLREPSKINLSPPRVKQQQFISTFCTLYESNGEGDSDSYSQSQLDRDILVAYRSIKRSVLSDVDLIMTPVDLSTPGSIALTEMQQGISQLDLFTGIISDRIDCISNDFSSQSRPLRTGTIELAVEVRRLINAVDVDDAQDCLSQIMHYFTLNEKSTLSSLRDIMLEARLALSERMGAFIHSVDDINAQCDDSSDDDTERDGEAEQSDEMDID